VTASALWWLAGAAAAAMIIAFFLAPAVRRRSLRRARLARGGSVIVLDGAGPRPASPGEIELVHDDAAIESARRDAHAAWAELLDTMVDFDVLVDDAETPRATGERLGQMPGLVPVRGRTGLLARAEERARYARTPLHPDGLDEAVHATRRALAQRATRRQRIEAVLLPRSVLLRWRTAWVGWMSRGIGTVGRIRETVAQASPRRLLTERAGR
jgi:hypothetical protein